MERAKVYELINGERSYQDTLPPSRTDGSSKTVGDYLVLLDVYIRRAKDDWAGNAGYEQSLDEIRKIAGIAVRCMEEHDAPARSI